MQEAASPKTKLLFNHNHNAHRISPIDKPILKATPESVHAVTLRQRAPDWRPFFGLVKLEEAYSDDCQNRMLYRYQNPKAPDELNDGASANGGFAHGDRVQPPEICLLEFESCPYETSTRTGSADASRKRLLDRLPAPDTSAQPRTFDARTPTKEEANNVCFN